MSKYAIMIQLSEDDWIYITEPDGTMFEVRPVVYETFEQAEQAARVWSLKGKEHNVKVVSYDEQV